MKPFFDNPPELPTGTFDWAIPTDWVKHVRATVDMRGRKCGGNIVWDYSGQGTLGRPFGVNAVGRAILAELAQHSKALLGE